MTLVVDDKRSPNEIKKLLRAHASYSKKISYAGKVILQMRVNKQKKHDFPKHDIALKGKAESGLLALCNPANVNISGDMHSYFVSSLAEKCLSEILYNVIRDEKGYPCYSIGAYLGDIHNAKYDINLVHCLVSPTKIDEVKKEIRLLCLGKKSGSLLNVGKLNQICTLPAEN